MKNPTEKCEKHLTPDQLKVMKQIGTIADSVNERCYVVGGLVRDCLLGKEGDDLDFVCTNVSKVADQLTEQKLAKGIGNVEKTRFLTKIIHFPNGIKVDLVEPRQEIYTSDSIKPIVEKGNLETDANRRDFTINTLRIGVNQDNWMKIDDPTHRGLNDLENMILDTPLEPNQTFTDDPSRMLRAVRFSSCKNMTMNDRVKDGIISNKKAIHRVPNELVHKEIVKGINCNDFIQKLDEVGLLEEILPEVTNLKGIKQNPIGHTEDAYNHTIRYVNELPPDPTLRMVGLLHDTGKVETSTPEGHSYEHEKVSGKHTDDVMERLRYSKDESKRIKKLVENHMVLHELSTNPRSNDRTFRRFVTKYNDIIPDLELMSRADILSDHPNPNVMLSQLDRAIEKIHDIQQEDGNMIKGFKLVIGGNDLKALGFSEGKRLGKIKKNIEELVQEGTLPNEKKALLEYITETYKK